MKFQLFPCVKQTQDEDLGYEGTVVTLVRANNDSLVVFFPIPDDTASMINYLLDGDEDESDDKITIHSKFLGIYQTMLNSWQSSGLFLSGITMDTKYETSEEENVIVVNLIISNMEDGMVDSLLSINFQHSLILAAMEKLDINLSDTLLNKLLPQDDDDDDNDNDDTNKQLPLDSEQFPVDEHLLDIAKQIMSKKE